MTDGTNIKNRIVEFLSYLEIGQGKFEKNCGLSNGTVNNIKDGISSPNIYKIIKTYPKLNVDWLITGEGDMLKSDNSLPIRNNENTVSYRFVPLLNLDAVGGMRRNNSAVGEIEYVEQLIPFTEARDGDIALTISGDSMSPTCPAGSKVLVREVQNWREYFGFGNLFVILLADGRRILKEVLKYSQDPGNYVLCKSHNDKYPEEELPKSMIVGVYKVIKILNERGW